MCSSSDSPGGSGNQRLDLRFGPITADCAQALVDLFERNASSAARTFDPFVLTAQRARLIASAPGKEAYFAAQRADRLVAFSMLRGFAAGYETPSLGIFVDHERRGEGIGREVMSRTIAAARLRGCPGIRLSVYADNCRALGLYTSLGFVERERTTASGREKLVMHLDLGG